MADIIIRQGGSAPTGMTTRFMDMSDGAHARMEALAPGSRSNRSWTGSTAETDKVLWTPKGGQRIVISLVVMSSQLAQVVELEASGEDIIPPLYLGANGGAVIPFPNGGYALGTGQAITFTTTNAVPTSIVVYGRES